jgi:hypothetical protein
MKKCSAPPLCLCLPRPALSPFVQRPIVTPFGVLDFSCAAFTFAGAVGNGRSFFRRRMKRVSDGTRRYAKKTALDRIRVDDLLWRVVLPPDLAVKVGANPSLLHHPGPWLEGPVLPDEETGLTS